MLIQKSLEPVLKQATFVVLEPDTVDLQGDVYSADEVRKAAHNFLLKSRRANLLHVSETETFSFVESWVSQADMEINGQSVKKGTWVATIQVNQGEDADAIWEGIVSGELCGLSIGCTATVEDISNES